MLLVRRLADSSLDRNKDRSIVSVRVTLGATLVFIDAEATFSPFWCISAFFFSDPDESLYSALLLENSLCVSVGRCGCFDVSLLYPLVFSGVDHFSFLPQSSTPLLLGFIFVRLAARRTNIKAEESLSVCSIGKQSVCELSVSRFSTFSLFHCNSSVLVGSSFFLLYQLHCFLAQRVLSLSFEGG